MHSVFSCLLEHIFPCWTVLFHLRTFFKYNLSTFDGGCSAPFGVIILCVLLSIFLLSCIVKSIVPALCQMTPTVHVIVLSIIFFEYSFELTSFFTLLRYFQIFFIALCLIWLSCSISKYLYPAVSISSAHCLAVSIHLNALFFLVVLLTPYTCICQASYLRLGTICAMCLLNSFVNSSHVALGHPQIIDGWPLCYAFLVGIHIPILEVA